RGTGRRGGRRDRTRRARRLARARPARRIARGSVLQPDRRGGSMIALVRGELIKTATTRTVLGYAALGVSVAIANVLVVTLSGDWHRAGDKQQAIAGLPFWLILLGLVGAAGEYRHRTAAPAALATAGRRGRLLLARAGAYAWTGLALGALAGAVALALG